MSEQIEADAKGALEWVNMYKDRDGFILGLERAGYVSRQQMLKEVLKVVESNHLDGFAGCIVLDDDFINALKERFGDGAGK